MNNVFSCIAIGMQLHMVCYQTVPYAPYGSIPTHEPRYDIPVIFQDLLLCCGLHTHCAFISTEHLRSRSKFSWTLSAPYPNTSWRRERKLKNKYSLSSNMTMVSTSKTESSKSQEAPLSFKSTVWEDFGFSDECKKTVKTNKQSTNEHCFVIVGYSSGNTSNMASHLCSHHPAIAPAGIHCLYKFVPW